MHTCIHTLHTYIHILSSTQLLNIDADSCVYNIVKYTYVHTHMWTYLGHTHVYTVSSYYLARNPMTHKHMYCCFVCATQDFFWHMSCKDSAGKPQMPSIIASESSTTSCAEDICREHERSVFVSVIVPVR